MVDLGAAIIGVVGSAAVVGVVGSAAVVVGVVPSSLPRLTNQASRSTNTSRPTAAAPPITTRFVNRWRETSLACCWYFSCRLAF